MKETRRMRSTALAASVLALVVGGAAIAQPVVRAAANTPARSTILPGHWEYGYRVAGIPVSSESKCLKPADVEQFSKGICTRKYRCDYTTNVVRDGKIQLKGTWTDKKDRVSPVSANGTYTPESFQMDIHLKTISGMNLAGSMNAKRVSAECPADETAAN